MARGPALRIGRLGRSTSRPWGWGLVAFLGCLLAGPRVAGAQDSAAVVLEVGMLENGRDASVRTVNLLADTPWLSALRQGLPVRLQYRLEVWRSREGWFDEVARAVEWTVLVQHEPLLDQFSVVRFIPPRRVLENRYATPGALASALGIAYQLPIAPAEPGRYYYSATLTVTTLSDSDLDQFQRLLRAGLDPTNASGGSLAERARRLVLRLAGLPAVSVSGRSAEFEIR